MANRLSLPVVASASVLIVTVVSILVVCASPNAASGHLPPAANNGQIKKEVLAKIKRATVYIRVTLPDGHVLEGSGFFGVEKGLVLTNAHVLGMLNANSPKPKQVEIVYQNGEPDSKTFQGKILGVDRSSDLALLRVEDPQLPEPLEVKAATGLIETQPVYAVGFPLGEQLGKNITITSTTVTSLRKMPTGELDRVQVNGGIQPGNSGGPIVNTDGEVVGVAVAIIEGTQLSFAVPGEYVHVVLNGRITEIASGISVRDGDQRKMKVSLGFLDPLNRIQKVSCDWWIAPAGKSRQASRTQPKPQPGDSPHQQLEMNYKGSGAQADIVLPASLPKGHTVWVQPVYVNGTGKPAWASAISYVPSIPVDKQPANLTLKHYWGARPLEFTTISNLRVTRPGAADVSFNVNIVAKMTESMVAEEQGNAVLRMRYMRYEIGVPTKFLTPKDNEKLKRVVQMVGTLHADLVVDSKNNLKKNTVDVSKSPVQARNDLADLHSQIQEALESLSVPLPGKKMQPGEFWKAKRPLMIFTGQRGESSPMEVTYVFHGVRERDNVKEGVIGIIGVAKDKRKGGVTVTGRVTGFAYLDLETHQIASAEVKAELNIASPNGENIVDVLESKMERTLGKEVLNVRDSLTAQEPVDDKKRPFKVHTVNLEAGKPCVVSLESFKGPGLFDTYLRVEDANGKVLAEDDDRGVDLNSLVVFTPPAAGTYRIVATCFQPAMGNYLLVVRQ